MSTHIELLQSTRAEIVNLLKRQGTMSVETLATELEISKVAVRRHLDQLEDQGFIGHSLERCERGRPKFIYSLTDEGDGLFPNRSADFACDLLAQIGTRYGAGAIDALLMDQADVNIASLKHDLEGRDFDSRVQAVAKQFNDRGYVADIERLDDGSYRIVEHNCPIRDVADLYPQVCREELRVYSEVTGGSVVKTCCMIANDARSCEYRILPFEGTVPEPQRALAESAEAASPVRPGPELVSLELTHEPAISSSATTGPGDSGESILEGNGDSAFRRSSRKVCMSVCVNVHCSMNGADELVEHLVANYGVAPDVPTEAGLSLELTYCFGACDSGPNVEIDGQFSDGVTIERLDEMLAALSLNGDQDV